MRQNNGFGRIITVVEKSNGVRKVKGPELEARAGKPCCHIPLEYIWTINGGTSPRSSVTKNEAGRVHCELRQVHPQEQGLTASGVRVSTSNVASLR